MEMKPVVSLNGRDWFHDIRSKGLLPAAGTVGNI